MQKWRQWLILPALLLAAPASAVEYERLSVTGGTLLLEWRSDFTPQQRHTISEWLNSVATTTRLLHGALPLAEIRVVLQAFPGTSAVPFARVLRDEPEGVHFYLSPDRTLDEFLQDWTAYHELSHLFIPYPGQASIWFSEGLATYYQNILQLRAGLLTPAEVRAKFAEGFARGQADSAHGDLTLSELSQEMRERRAYMRVYWSGTLYFLQADMALRSRVGPDARMQSLDRVLREFGRCCRARKQQWTGFELATEFDRIADGPLFLPLYQEFARSTAQPDFMPAMRSPRLELILEATH